MNVRAKNLLLGAALLVHSAYSVAATISKDSASSPDREIETRVEAALDSAPYLYAEHITVSSKQGIVTLHGLVGSEWDMRDAIEVTSRVDGVKEVVDDLEIWEFGGPRR